MDAQIEEQLAGYISKQLEQVDGIKVDAELIESYMQSFFDMHEYKIVRIEYEG